MCLTGFRRQTRHQVKVKLLWMYLRTNSGKNNTSITFSVPPVRKENDKEGEPEIQELLHVSKIERTSRKRKTSKQGPTGNCVICWENSCDCAFCPCGHVTTCYKCGMTLYLKNKSCPMCRQIITNVMKIYFSCQK